jgi:hypothetical protein
MRFFSVPNGTVRLEQAMAKNASNYLPFAVSE